MVADAPVACFVLAAPRALKLVLEELYPRMFHNADCPESAVIVCEVLLAPMNTLSNTSSLPVSPVKVTVGLGVPLEDVPVPTAPFGDPKGVV